MRVLARPSDVPETERSFLDGKEPTAVRAGTIESDVSAEHRWLAVPLISASALAWTILVTAVLARIYIYWLAPSLWVDEVSLSMAVITHPLLALIHKLDFQQLAPPGFVWMQRVIVDLAGVSEHTLRLFPLIAGCLSVIAVWDMSRRFLDRGSALIAATLIGFAPFALRYSNEAKQYGVELFVTAVLLWLRSYSGDMPRKPTMQAAVIAAGAVACLLSLPAVFVLAGLWASYAAVALQAENRRPALIFVGLAGLIWCAVFGVLYMTLLAPNTDPYMLAWWGPSHLSLHLRDVHLAGRIAHGFLDPFLSYGPWMAISVLTASYACLMLLGGYALRKLRGSQVALLFVTPLALCLGAALAGKWYLSPRLMLWTAPLCALLIAATICWTATLVGRFSSLVRLMAFDAILAFSLIAAAYCLRDPVNEDLRGAVEFTQRAMQPGDVVYVFAHAMPGWMFYSMNWAKPDSARFNWLKHATDEAGPQYANIPHRGHRVVEEGLGLWHPYRQGIELAGIGEGGFATDAAPSPDGHPDPGWSDNEVQRILAAHGRRIILLASGTTNGPIWTLLDCLWRHGGIVIDEFRSKRGRVYVVEMRGSGSGVPCS